MATSPWLKVKRFLRSPRVIVGELAAIALSGILMTVVPQAPDTGGAAWATQTSGVLAKLAADLGLDRVARAPWFVGLVLLAALSLAIALREQLASLARRWRAALGPAGFESAPFRREFERPARLPRGGERTRIETTGRFGLAGSPLFHLGLMIVVLAGIVRMLFGAEAVVDLFEGEILPAEPDAYGAQWGGSLARPFVLRHPVRLDHVETKRYPSGALKEMSAVLTVLAPGRETTHRLAVNQPFDLGRERLYLDAAHGPVALLERRQGAATEARALLLQEKSAGRFEGKVILRGGVELRARAEMDKGLDLPARVETRVLRGGALLFSGSLAPGEGIRLWESDEIALVGIRQWTRLRGSRDASTGMAYLGLGLLVAGALVMFAVVKVDTIVVVKPLPGGNEHVLVALRAQRFGPLFAGRFESLVSEEGGGVGIN